MTVRWRRWWPVAVVLALAWGVVGYYTSKPTDFHDYREAAVHAAQSAHYSLSTTDQTVRAHLRGQTFDGYVRSTLDDSAKATAGAAKQFAGEAPVDAATVRMRDELGPLLLAATHALGDLQRAEQSGDDGELRRGVEALPPIDERLSEFIEAHL
jgi:hypothetical protein